MAVFLIHENDVYGRNKPAFWVDNEMTNYHFTLNLSYNFLDNLMVGFEPQMGYKELKMDQDMTKGKDALRINFGVLYNF